MSPVQVSIVVPTRDRAGSLRRLLASLDDMETPDALRAEVLVVDNGSTDETESLLRREQSKERKFLLRVLQEQHKGKASALNCGLAATAGDFILVVDDDVVVDRRWLLEHLDCFRATSFDAVQGRILPGVDPEGQPADPSRLREYNIPIVDRGDEIREVRGIIATNIALRRRVFETVGFYDPRLGAGASGFGEDTEYSMRIRKAGFKMGYAPRAVVYHELDPARYGRAYNRRIHYRKGLSRTLHRHDSIPFRVVPNLVASCIRFGLYRALGKSEKAYKSEGRIMRYWGYLVGKARSMAGSSSDRTG